jgi:hypothetical protein
MILGKMMAQGGASFPKIENYTINENIGPRMSFDLAYPSGINAGDLLIILTWIDGGYTGFNDVTGFTQRLNSHSDYIGVGVYYRVADGTESGSVTVGIASTAYVISSMVRVSGAAGTIETGYRTSTVPADRVTIGSATSITANSLALGFAGTTCDLGDLRKYNFGDTWIDEFAHGNSLHIIMLASRELPTVDTYDNDDDANWFWISVEDEAFCQSLIIPS